MRYLNERIAYAIENAEEGKLREAVTDVLLPEALRLRDSDTRIAVVYPYYHASNPTSFGFLFGENEYEPFWYSSSREDSAIAQFLQNHAETFVTSALCDKEVALRFLDALV